MNLTKDQIIKEILDSKIYQASYDALLVQEDRNFDDTLSSYSEYWSPHPMYLTYWLQVKQEIEAI